MSSAENNGKGLFITFEGPEGSGKSTQCSRLVERLRAEPCEVLQTREPGGTATGEEIRAILQYNKTGEPIVPEAEVLLFAASRAQLVRNVLLPALESGQHVVCDRFADSTTVYQGYGRCFGVEKMVELNDFATCGLVPDLTFLIDLDVEIGFARLKERYKESGETHDRMEQETLVFHQRVRDGYLELSRRWPERIQVLDGNRDQELVATDIWKTVSQALRRDVG